MRVERTPFSAIYGEGGGRERGGGGSILWENGGCVPGGRPKCKLEEGGRDGRGSGIVQPHHLPQHSPLPSFPERKSIIHHFLSAPLFPKFDFGVSLYPGNKKEERFVPYVRFQAEKERGIYHLSLFVSETKEGLVNFGRRKKS